MNMYTAKTRFGELRYIADTPSLAFHFFTEIIKGGCWDFKKVDNKRPKDAIAHGTIETYRPNSQQYKGHHLPSYK